MSRPNFKGQLAKIELASNQGIPIDASCIVPFLTTSTAFTAKEKASLDFILNKGNYANTVEKIFELYKRKDFSLIKINRINSSIFQNLYFKVYGDFDTVLKYIEFYDFTDYPIGANTNISAGTNIVKYLIRKDGVERIDKFVTAFNNKVREMMNLYLIENYQEVQEVMYNFFLILLYNIPRYRCGSTLEKNDKRKILLAYPYQIVGAMNYAAEKNIKSLNYLYNLYFKNFVKEEILTKEILESKYLDFKHIKGKDEKGETNLYEVILNDINLSKEKK